MKIFLCQWIHRNDFILVKDCIKNQQWWIYQIKYKPQYQKIQKSSLNNQANLAENKHGVQERFMIIHGLERKTFREQGESEETLNACALSLARIAAS